MNLVSPVVPGLKEYETKIGAENDPEAVPILRSPEGVVLTRWTLSDDERAAIASGADVFLWVSTANQPFHPVKLEVTGPDDARELKYSMRLDDEFELRSLLNDANKAMADMNARQMAILNGDAEVKNLAEKAQRARQTLERKKQEVFSNKPSSIEVVQ